ncbi:MAG: DNA-binding protein [Bacteroidota bacterium]
MEKIVLQLDTTKIQWVKTEAKRLNLSVEDYIEKVIYKHAEISQNEPLLNPVDADELQSPDQQSFEAAMERVMEKNKELYKRLA